ncbi:MAG: chemotaxis protein CheA [Oscillospiraceae bacterium]|jgi:two-component system chemotaxis sensor kinase CheA|nr:chemotaxis protein CheA [Oscillospiraceae bacterium]
MSMDSMLEMFIFENMQLTERLEEILIEGEQLGGLTGEHINEIFRVMHTIKGSAAMMEYTHISTLAHSVEDMFFYIREHGDASPDWPVIADLCLESADFFKAEVAKIQSGLPSDGDEGSLLTRIRAYMKVLTAPPGDDAGAEAPVAAVPETPETKAADGPSDAPPATAGNRYRVHVFFQDGCKMENIRAYQIANALQDVSGHIETVPEDLLEDCSDYIIANGAVLFVETELPIDDIRGVVSTALFVQSFEVTQESSNAAAPEGEPADVPAAPEAAQKPPAAAEEKPPPAPAAPTGAEAAPPPAEHKAPAAGVPAKPAAAPVVEAKQNFISVNVNKLDRLMDLVGELVISVSMVVSSPDLEGLQLDNFEKAAALLTKNTGELQDVIMSVRMIPVSSTFHKMHRIIRDLSRKLGKEVELTILGEETEVDKNIIDNLSDPLMHIIRNSMDHGIEDAREDRIAAGKPPMGRIVLEARNSGSDVIISCADDGRGLDRDKIFAKAQRQGLIAKPDWDYTDKEIYNFIMLPGFSTNEQFTELSGRGVGMDVVKKNIEKVGGNVLLDSVPGKGMTVTIRIPLTLAILAGIEIQVGRNFYIVPTLNIREAFKPRGKDIVIDPDGNEMILFRGECYAIVRLHRLFQVQTDVARFEDGIIIMVEDEGHMVGLFADTLVGEQQIVVKPIPSFILRRIGKIRGVSGCTILGDGSISLIIDVKALTQAQ